QAEDGIRYCHVTGVQTCALPISVPDGELFGFLGPNGAGKTTTLRMIAGILQPTSGSIHLAGIDLATDPLAAKSKLGFIPDRPFKIGRASCRKESTLDSLLKTLNI